MMSMRNARLAVLLLAIAGWGGDRAHAQTAVRRAVSPAELLAYPGFFQGQAIVVRGNLATRDRAVLTSPSIDRAIPLIITGTSPADGPVELRATFWDVGRLQRDDPRLSNLGLIRLLPNNGEGDWPRPGDVVALIVSDVTAVKPASGPPTLRLIALDPDAYVGQRVTVTGQFRGRNLFGDLPQAPSSGQWDFVLHNGDGALWVTGERPRGKGFNLDVGARVDTRAWLQVTGTVRTARGLVWIEAAPPLTLARPDQTFVVEALPPPEMGARPDVIFSDPEDGDTNVPLKKVIRLQFSRDMNPDSFKGAVHWRYAASESSEEMPQASLSARYEKANRSLEVKITAADELTRLRNVALEITDSAAATDGAKLRPWSVTFTFAGE
jgi:Bacterial Ig-like domain